MPSNGSASTPRPAARDEDNDKENDDDTSESHADDDGQLVHAHVIVTSGPAFGHIGDSRVQVTLLSHQGNDMWHVEHASQLNKQRASQITLQNQ